ncbi:MAG: O-antigen ligase family protein [Peptococcales bacterium]
MVALKKKKKSSHHVDTNKIITHFLIILICTGLIFDGFFFESQRLIVSIVITAVFLALFLIAKNIGKTLLFSPVSTYLGLMFMFINLVTLFIASDLRAALGNFLVVASSLMLFLITLQNIRNTNTKENNTKLFLEGLFWSTVAIAVVGLISYVFGVNILNSYQSDNRLIATIGYANTAALVFMMAIFIGLYLHSTVMAKDYIYNFTNSLLLLALLGTKSRGVFLLFFFLIFVYLVLIRKEERVQGIKNLAYVFIPSLLVFPLFYNGTFFTRNAKGIIISILSLLCLFTFAYLTYLKRKIKISTKNILIPGTVAIVLILGVVVFWGGYDSVVSTLTNNDIVQRIKTINLEQQQVQERLIFAQDALKILKDNLLLGTGGGGWKAEYRQYQTFLYHTSETHNHYIQILVENGLLGFLVYLSLWLILLSNIYRKLKQERSMENITLAILVISIFLHSFIDFDLSYPALTFLWWILLAISHGNDSLIEIKLDSRKTLPLVTATILLITVNTSLWVGWSYGKEATKYMQQNNLPKAIRNFETSIMFDPVNATYLTNLAQLYFINNESSKDKGLATINKSLKYNSTNYEWYIIKTRMLAENGDFEEAYKNSLKAIQMAPMVEVVYYDIAREFVDRVKTHPELTQYALEIIRLAKDETEKIDSKHLPWWHGDLPYSNRVKALEERLNK